MNTAIVNNSGVLITGADIYNLTKALNGPMNELWRNAYKMFYID